MPSITSLVKQLKIDYPAYQFTESDTFLWSHSDQTIYYCLTGNNASLLLHELAHALLNHRDYNRDIQLLAMERDAWDKAKEISKNYNLEIDEDFIQSNLDTYREWLHNRSRCPDCKATGLQVKNQIYSCPNCKKEWRVNEARTCGLKRYLIDK